LSGWSEILVRDHDELQLPGPPTLRVVIGGAVLVLAAAVLLGLVPFGAVTFGVALVLIGAGLVV
jgi:hypothetical protein